MPFHRPQPSHHSGGLFFCFSMPNFFLFRLSMIYGYSHYFSSEPGLQSFHFSHFLNLLKPT